MAVILLPQPNARAVLAVNYHAVEVSPLECLELRFQLSKSAWCLLRDRVCPIAGDKHDRDVLDDNDAV
jgi:hypothetical protein